MPGRPDCKACGGSGVSSRGHACVCNRGPGNKYVLVPLKRAKTTLELYQELRRMVQGAEAPPPTEEQLAEQERQSKLTQLRKLREGIEEIEGDMT